MSDNVVEMQFIAPSRCEFLPDYREELLYEQWLTGFSKPITHMDEEL